MKNLLSTIAIVGVILLSSGSVFGQAQKYLNFGLFYASIEFPVSNLITVAPQISTDYDFNKFIIAAKGNFYLDDVFGVTEDWDTYAGVNLGWRLESNNDGFNWGIHIGGRWFWDDKWGVNAEFGGGSGVIGGVGITMKM